MQLYSLYKDDFRNNLILALPIMAGQLGQISVNVVDNVMVGQLGSASLAAVSFSVAIFVIFFVVGMGISFALPPLVSKAAGAGKTNRISQYFKHSLIINICYALISIAIVEIIMPYTYNMGQDPEVVRLAQPYLRISMWSILPMMFFQTFRSYSEGMSETMPPMIAMLIGNVFNVIFNYLLIFGKFGFPALGVAGAALGTLLSRLIMLAILVVLLKNWKDLWLPLKNARFRYYSKLVFKKVLSLGIPSSLQMFFEVSAFGGAALIMGMLGKEEQAAHQIAINLASITFMICTGLGMAATVRVGNHLGKKDYPGLRRVGFSAFMQIILFMSVSALLFVWLRHWLPTIYIHDEKVIRIAALLLVMAAIFQISDGLQVVGLGVLRGLQDVKIPTMITFVAYWIIGLPVSYVTAVIFDYGPLGVWLGLVLGLTVSAVMLSWRFHSSTKSMLTLTTLNKALSNEIIT